jgi:hypothetical protein
LQIVKQMSNKTKKFLITTQQREVTAVHKKPAAFFKYCECCQEKVEMMTLDAITFQTGMRTREIFRLIENESLHSCETERGHLLVCINSLQNLDNSKLERKNDK